MPSISDASFFRNDCCQCYFFNKEVPSSKLSSIICVGLFICASLTYSVYQLMGLYVTSKLLFLDIRLACLSMRRY